MSGSDELVVVVDKSELLTRFRKAFIDTFVQCFGVDELKAESALQKYEHAREVWCAVGFVGGSPAAFYSVVIFMFAGERIALSTDTMSNGLMKSATKKLGLALYQDLRESRDVKVVCGFPNENIILIRKKALKWQIHPERMTIFLVIGLMGGSFDGRDAPVEPFDRRSIGGGSKRVLGVPIVGYRRVREDHPPSGIFFWASLYRDFPLSVALPARFSKRFGYVGLVNDSEALRLFEAGRFSLSFDSIDVP